VGPGTTPNTTSPGYPLAAECGGRTARAMIAYKEEENGEVYKTTDPLPKFACRLPILNSNMTEIVIFTSYTLIVTPL
jgi:hypothetical protein